MNDKQSETYLDSETESKRERTGEIDRKRW